MASKFCWLSNETNLGLYRLIQHPGVCLSTSCVDILQSHCIVKIKTSCYLNFAFLMASDRDTIRSLYV